MIFTLLWRWADVRSEHAVPKEVTTDRHNRPWARPWENQETSLWWGCRRQAQTTGKVPAPETCRWTLLEEEGDLVQFPGGLRRTSPCPRGTQVSHSVPPLHGKGAATLYVGNRFSLYSTISHHYNGMLTMVILCLQFSPWNMEVAKKFIQVFPFWPAQ